MLTKGKKDATVGSNSIGKQQSHRRCTNRLVIRGVDDTLNNRKVSRPFIIDTFIVDQTTKVSTNFLIRSLHNAILFRAIGNSLQVLSSTKFEKFRDHSILKLR